MTTMSYVRTQDTTLKAHKKHLKFIIPLFSLSLLIRLGLVLWSGFDGLYGQDAFAYFKFAREMQKALVNWELPGPFNWPLGYPAILMFGFLIFGAAPWVGQAISIISGALISPLIYLLSYEWLLLADREPCEAQKVGIFAGILIALSGQIILSSVVIMSDVPALFWVILSAWTLVRYVRTFKLSWLLVVIFALAWAVMSRWLYALLVLPWSVFLIWYWRRDFRISHAMIAVIFALLIFAPQMLHSYANPEFVMQHQWVEGWYLFNALKSYFVNADGTFIYPLPVFIFYALAAVHPFYLFPIFIPILLWGFWRVVRLPALGAMILMFGWGLAIYIFLIGIPYENLRFSMAIFPPIIIITAVGLVDLWKIPKRQLRRGLLMLVIIGCAGMFFWGIRGTKLLFDRKQANLETVAWLQDKIPPNSTL
ncbi:MAG: ArnT family glycosyltransferase, partial [bacterium]